MHQHRILWGGLILLWASTAQAADMGTLTLRGNGEDFVRQGFVSKDGWQIDFDHVYVHLSDVTAYQTDPPFNPDASTEIEAEVEVALESPITVDLAEGDADADPIVIESLSAPAGRYNALSWRMTPAAEGPIAGSSLVLMGTAAKDELQYDFNLQIDQEYAYLCGDFVGDERKGILSAEGEADLEATFHFDHVFGDGEAPSDDPINTGALGFDPLAALMEEGSITADLNRLQTELSESDYNTLLKALIGLGHVGEGHCEETVASR